MKLGISTSLNGLSPIEWGEKLKSIGCKAAVFPVDSNASNFIIEEYAKQAKEKNIEIAEVGIWRNALSMDKEEAKRNLEYSIKQLLLAEKVKAKCCVNVAGAKGSVWDGGYRENYSKETYKETVKMIQTVIDEVKPKNTVFCLEPMPWMIPDGPDEYLKLIEDVGRDEFLVHMDIINMINSPKRFFFHEEFTEEVFSKLHGKIKSCHLKDIRLLSGYTYKLEECAVGDGDFNFKKYCELADKENPDMPMIIEHINDDRIYFEKVKFVKNKLKL